MRFRDSLGLATLIGGFLLTVAGVLMLFFPAELMGGLAVWWPAGLIALGALLLSLVAFRKGSPGALFNGLLLALTGVFVLVLNTGLLPPELTLKELWPVFMGIVGVSLIPYGARYRRTVRVTLVIPGLFLLFLMVVFLLFSLSVVEGSLTEFVGRWWPLILVLMGVSLMTVAWLRDSRPRT